MELKKKTVFMWADYSILDVGLDFKPLIILFSPFFLSPT